MNMKLQRALIPGFKMSAEARKSAFDDWRDDAQGFDVMSPAQFFKAMFEMADLWVDSLNEWDYVYFLQAGFRFRVSRLSQAVPWCPRPAQRTQRCPPAPVAPRRTRCWRWRSRRLGRRRSTAQSTQSAASLAAGC